MNIFWKKIKYFFLFPLLFLFIGIVFGYDNIITHPQITDAAVKVYQNQFNRNLTQQQTQWIIKGSIDEDADPRYLNHYYDPTTGNGLDDYDEYVANHIVLSKIKSPHVKGLSAKEWAKKQNGAISHTGDYSERAILKNYRDGNFERAYQGIGHILHLVQDMSVPAHTRNDSHAEGDPYEGWAKQNGKIDLSNVDFIAINNLDQAFDELALFSHNNFFSKDTIKNIDIYKKIIISDNGKDVGYLVGIIDGVEIKLAYSKNPDLMNPIYQVDNYQIHYDYWQILHPKAVGYSAGVIDYFIKQFEQIDAEKQAQQDSGLLASIWNKTRITFSNLDDNAKYVWGDFFMPARAALSDAWDFTGESYRDVKNELFIKIVDQMPMANIGQQLDNFNTNQTILEQNKITLVEEPQDKNDEITQNIQSNQSIISESQNNTQQQSQLSPIPSEPEIIHAPYYRAPEVIHAPYQSSTEQTQSSNQTGVITNQFQGQFNSSFAPTISENEENQPQDISSQESTDQSLGEEAQDQNADAQSEDPATDLTSSPQTSSGQEVPIDSDQNSEPEPQLETATQPILPDINFYLTDYEVRKFDFVLNWEDRNNVTQEWELQYKLAPSFAWQSIALSNSLESAANSYVFTAEYDDLTYYFRIRAQDDSNNFSDWIELPVDISSKPVVINEVAWMGTQASASDEWIELANKTNQEIDLAGWILYINARQIGLTGKISPNGFYLLERAIESEINTENENSAISNIQADQIYTGGLTNPNGDYGQQLILQDDLGNIADTTMSAYAGDNAAKKTSERVSIWASGGAGAIGNNWKTYSGQGSEAQDADSNIIMGTPRAKNSVADQFLAFNSQPNKSLVFLKNRGIVLVESGIWIPAGVKILIEPGAVLKFGSQGSLTISGELIAKGMADDKIVFTSVSDDEHGSDINGNDNTVINWMGINFLESSKGELDNIVLKNVGSIWISNTVSINKANVKISNSIFENNSENVLVFDYSDANISNSEFRNNTGRALSVSYANANILGSIFENNTGAGIWLGGIVGDVNIENNNFTGNKSPVETNRLTNFNLSSNSMSNNTNNGILVYIGMISEDKNSITISSDMPFVFMDSGTVGEGKTLSLSPGTVFKFPQTAFGIYGTLNAVGTPDQPIVFTALEDDSYGGDTNNNGNASVPGEAAWYWMQFVSGENSVLDNVVVKYAGRIGYSMGGPPSGGSGVAVEPGASNFTLRNSMISDSVVGATVSSDGAIIENTTFSNNTQTGINVSANNATISNVTFENNQKAFQSTSPYMATILLSNLIFNGNTYDYWPEDLIVQPQ